MKASPRSKVPMPQFWCGAPLPAQVFFPLLLSCLAAVWILI